MLPCGPSAGDRNDFHDRAGTSHETKVAHHLTHSPVLTQGMAPGSIEAALKSLDQLADLRMHGMLRAYLLPGQLFAPCCKQTIEAEPVSDYILIGQKPITTFPLPYFWINRSPLGTSASWHDRYFGLAGGYLDTSRTICVCTAI